MRERVLVLVLVVRGRCSPEEYNSPFAGSNALTHDTRTHATPSTSLVPVRSLTLSLSLSR